MPMKHVALAAAFILLASGLSACGKRGPLEPPSKVEKTAQADKAAAEDAEVIEEREEAVQQQHDPFILDILL